MRRKRNEKHSILHSGERHRNRNCKRQIRNLFLEIIFIIILSIVAIKFVKKEEEKPKITTLGIDRQKEIINNEMNTIQEIIKDEKSQELKIPEIKQEGISIIKASLQYIENENQTIIKIDVKNYGDNIGDARFLLALIDNNEKTIEETYVNVPKLEKNQETRLNIVLNNDLRETNRVEIRKEK